MNRRGWLKILLVLAVSIDAYHRSAARAEDKYPSRLVKLVVPAGAGSATDVRARQIAEKLGKALGQNVIVENRPGAGMTLGAAYVAKSAPDGYTLLLAGTSDQTVAPVFHANLPYDPKRDFVPVTQMTLGPAVFVVNPNLGVRSVADLIALAKRKPGELTCATNGAGTVSHLILAQLGLVTGTQIAHVPYKSSAQGLTDVAGGNVSMAIDFLVGSGSLIRAGKLTPIMLTGGRRAQAFPDIPTAMESGFAQLDLMGWTGLVAPRGTPQAVVNRLHSELVRIMRTPEMEQIVADAGGIVPASTPEEFGAYMQAQRKKMADIVRLTGVRTEQ